MDQGSIPAHEARVRRDTGRLGLCRRDYAGGMVKARRQLYPFVLNSAGMEFVCRIITSFNPFISCNTS